MRYKSLLLVLLVLACWPSSVGGIETGPEPPGKKRRWEINKKGSCDSRSQHSRGKAKAESCANDNVAGDDTSSNRYPQGNDDGFAELQALIERLAKEAPKLHVTPERRAGQAVQPFDLELAWRVLGVQATTDKGGEKKPPPKKKSAGGGAAKEREIKAKEQRKALALQLHPDKLPRDLDARWRSRAERAFVAVQLCFEARSRTDILGEVILVRWRHKAGQQDSPSDRAERSNIEAHEGESAKRHDPPARIGAGLDGVATGGNVCGWSSILVLPSHCSLRCLKGARGDEFSGPAGAARRWWARRLRRAARWRLRREPVRHL